MSRHEKNGIAIIFESTGTKWIPPSPKISAPRRFVLYHGMKLCKTLVYGRPRHRNAGFEEFGAPWLTGDDVAAALTTKRRFAGLHLRPNPSSHRRFYSGQTLRVASPMCTKDRYRGARQEQGHGRRIMILIASIRNSFDQRQQILLMIGKIPTPSRNYSPGRLLKDVASWSPP